MGSMTDGPIWLAIEPLAIYLLHPFDWLGAPECALWQGFGMAALGSS
jgi:hypothetical protein